MMMSLASCLVIQCILVSQVGVLVSCLGRKIHLIAHLSYTIHSIVTHWTTPILLGIFLNRTEFNCSPRSAVNMHMYCMVGELFQYGCSSPYHAVAMLQHLRREGWHESTRIVSRPSQAWCEWWLNSWNDHKLAAEHAVSAGQAVWTVPLW